MEVKNVWLETHGRRVEGLITELERFRLSGAYGGNLNLNEIITIFKGTKFEITRLQNQIEALTDALNKVQSEPKNDEVITDVE
jgi:hypothetical protein